MCKQFPSQLNGIKWTELNRAQQSRTKEAQDDRTEVPSKGVKELGLVHTDVGIFTNIAFSMWLGLSSTRKPIFRPLKLEVLDCTPPG